MKGLTFDPATHTYTLNGLPIPSVTQVIAGTQDFFGVSEEVLAAARVRGRLVHEVTAQYDLGMLTLKQMESDPENHAYLSAWVAFRKDTNLKAVTRPEAARAGWLTWVEMEVFSARHRYAGTIDRVALLDGEVSILDIKTAASPGRLHPAVGLQLAAYQQAYNEERPPLKAVGRYAVQLRPDGKYTLTQYVDKADFSVFLACLTLFNWRTRHL